jgi:hypothetical protein
MLFHDDTMPSFFRRPAWSPCGSFLAVPAGIFREHAGAKEQHATYLYQRDRFARPALRLPGIAPAVCVRFSPAFYALPGAPAPCTPSSEKKAGGKVGEKVEETVEEKVEANEVETAGGDAPTAADEAKVSLEPAKTIDLPYRLGL